MRWMGLDIGDKRIGIALSDPLEITAQSHSMLERRGLSHDLEHLRQIVDVYEVTGIVCGLPINMNGSEGPMAEKVRQFAGALAEITGVQPVFWDERFSTASAQRVLIEADMSRGKRRQKVDQLAAAIILQNFLDSRNR